MIGMVGDPKVTFDQLGHAGTGPQVGRESRCLRPLEKFFLQGFPLFRGQPGGSARGRMGLECAFPALREGRLPSPHASAIDTHPLGHFFGGMTFLKKIHRPAATAFQILGTSGRSHRGYLHLPV